MPCPHSRKPGPCSSCMAAPARRVDVVPGAAPAPGVPPRTYLSNKRGGAIAAARARKAAADG